MSGAAARFARAVALTLGTAAIPAFAFAASDVATGTASPLALHRCRLAGLEHDAQCGVLKRP
ncbi:MAG: hypothetical protein H7276_13010, partial [Caulobacter sp.]|nr:hypothetical protein [Vitreoscilla sp.]